jgi:hypothetical protein
MHERQRLAALATLVLVPQAALAIWLYGTRVMALGDVIPVCDFAVFYTGGTMAREGHLVAAYDGASYQATMRAVAADIGQMFWFYPPTMALIAHAFALSTYWRGYMLWMSISATASAYAAYRLDGWRGVAWMALFPATVVAAVYAQASLWLAPVLSEGLRLLEERPIVAGALFGLLSVKPHWLMVVVIALVAGRHAKALASVTATSAGLALAAIAVYGVEPWLAWRASVGSAIGWARQMEPEDVLSVYTSLPLAIAAPTQTLATLLSLAATVYLFARPHPHDLRMAVIPIAMSLTTPYLHFYDLVGLGIPVLVMLRRLDAAGQPWLPFASLAGAALWSCRVIGALFDVQPYPLLALVALGIVVRMAMRSSA